MERKKFLSPKGGAVLRWWGVASPPAHPDAKVVDAAASFRVTCHTTYQLSVSIIVPLTFA